jgi:hypothetical protein
MKSVRLPVRCARTVSYFVDGSTIKVSARQTRASAVRDIQDDLLLRSEWPRNGETIDEALVIDVIVGHSVTDRFELGQDGCWKHHDLVSGTSTILQRLRGRGLD